MSIWYVAYDRYKCGLSPFTANVLSSQLGRAAVKEKRPAAVIDLSDGCLLSSLPPPCLSRFCL